MSDSPDFLPILAAGPHETPDMGACFMEYTSLLAGEHFTDRPICVDDALSFVMQGFNDRLLDQDRPVLIPFLGRGIGLRAPRGKSYTDLQTEYPGDTDTLARLHTEATRQRSIDKDNLRRLAFRKVAAALGLDPTKYDTGNYYALARRLVGDFDRWCYDAGVRFDGHNALGRSDSAAVQEAVRYVEAVHTAYEEAMTELFPSPSQLQETHVSV